MGNIGHIHRTNVVSGKAKKYFDCIGPCPREDANISAEHEFLLNTNTSKYLNFLNNPTFMSCFVYGLKRFSVFLMKHSALQLY